MRNCQQLLSLIVFNVATIVPFLETINFGEKKLV